MGTAWKLDHTNCPSVHLNYTRFSSSEINCEQGMTLVKGEGIVGKCNHVRYSALKTKGMLLVTLQKAICLEPSVTHVCSTSAEGV